MPCLALSRSCSVHVDVYFPYYGPFWPRMTRALCSRRRFLISVYSFQSSVYFRIIFMDSVTCFHHPAVRYAAFSFPCMYYYSVFFVPSPCLFVPQSDDEVR